jgi:hypothetical protein
MNPGKSVMLGKERQAAAQLRALMPICVVVLGAVAYLMLCLISIGRTQGDIPYIFWPLFRESWIFPAILFAAWAEPGWKERIVLAAYALLSAQRWRCRDVPS